MINDTKTVFEHWTDVKLQRVADAPEHAEAGMLDGARREIERRATVKAEREKLNEKDAELRAKIKAANEAEEKQKQKESRRAEMFKRDEMVPEALNRFVGLMETQARIHYHYGGHREAFLLNVVTMAARSGKLTEIVEMFRNTEYAERWSVSHPNDPGIVVYFDEVFPAKKSKAA